MTQVTPCTIPAPVPIPGVLGEFPFLLITAGSVFLFPGNSSFPTCLLPPERIVLFPLHYLLGTPLIPSHRQHHQLDSQLDLGKGRVHRVTGSCRRLSPGVQDCRLHSPILKGATAVGTWVCDACPRLGSGRRKVMESGSKWWLGACGEDSAPETFPHISSMTLGNWKFFFLYYLDPFLLFVPFLNLPEQTCLHNQMILQGVKLNKTCLSPLKGLLQPVFTPHFINTRTGVSLEGKS